MNSFLSFIAYNSPIFYLIQSVWRDEAFSYFMARPGIFDIIRFTANDFNPPLYYLLLHFWVFLAGKSDIGLRMLSFLFHLGGVYYAFLLGRKLNGKSQAFYLAFFYLFNPMLIYYAFEMRMYSLYAFMATASIYYFHARHWKGYIISSVLGLYTHSFFAMLIASLAFYDFIHKKLRTDILKTISPLLFFIPWIPVLFIQFLKSKESWLFPVDWQLIKSVLGNLFTSYEGTPWYLWKYTAYLSFFILLFLIISLKNKKIKSDMFVIPVILPLLAILSYSVLKRPLYVNRYLIFITVFEVIGIFAGIISIKNNFLRKSAAFAWLIFVILFNFYIPEFRKKTDFKSAFAEINRIGKPQDAVYAKTPISFLESAYYYKQRDATFVYNPLNIHIPNYIGVNVLFPDVSRDYFPIYPARVFLINDDASYNIVISRK